MANHIDNRNKIIRDLHEELVGPSPQGKEIDCSGDLIFENQEQFYSPWRQKGSKEEILQRDRPLKRYGIGVLYPMRSIDNIDQSEETVLDTDDSVSRYSDDELEKADTKYEPITKKGMKNIEGIGDRADKGGVDPDPYDFDLSITNTYRPSSMGISFLARFPEGSKLVIEAPAFDTDKLIGRNGRYKQKKVSFSGKERSWWLRQAVSVVAEFQGEVICGVDGIVVPSKVEATNIEGLDLSIELFSRPHKEKNTRLLTICLVNRTKEMAPLDEYCLFQIFFRVTVISDDGHFHILPYPAAEYENVDDEEQSIDLLYRNAETYAVGHGCAADWELDSEQVNAKSVSAECLPIYETPNITPDITWQDGTSIEVSMAALAGLIPDDDGFDKLTELINAYEQWINDRNKEIQLLDSKYLAAAKRHLKACERCLERMKEGLGFLGSNSGALRAFRLMNQTILIQQLRSRRNPRLIKYNQSSKKIEFSEEYTEPDLLSLARGLGKWRAFQIAFLLMTVQSAIDGRIPERRTVELIWFPTGGGKTEAYLGLASFAMFMRRITRRDDSGCHVLMRYTLRLLTAQQFQRASSAVSQKIQQLKWQNRSHHKALQ
ncbi:MAG TPA: hypothetical protein ENH52_00250 [Nitrospirae bacterium]|nr:hypothetical protein [Nitrospirota bacterium]